MELKKSYKGFVIWLLCYIIALFAPVFLPLDGILLTRIVHNVCTIGLAILAYIIYKTGYIYWYNGITYEQAVKAGEDRCREYAWKHFKRFGIFAVGFLILSILTHLLQIGFWMDFIVLIVGIIGVAISTIKIKL